MVVLGLLLCEQSEGALNSLYKPDPQSQVRRTLSEKYDFFQYCCSIICAARASTSATVLEASLQLLLSPKIFSTSSKECYIPQAFLEDCQSPSCWLRDSSPSSGAS